MGHLRKCTLKDLHHVSENMRDMDRLEAVYQTGQDPDTALRVSYLASKIVAKAELRMTITSPKLKYMNDLKSFLKFTMLIICQSIC